MKTVSREEFFENYNIDSREHDVLNYWPSKSPSDEKYKKLTMFLIENEAFINMTDAFVRLINNDAHDDLIEYVLGKCSPSQEIYEIFINTCIRKHKLEYIEKIQKIFPCSNEISSFERDIILSNYIGNNKDTAFHFFVKTILNDSSTCGTTNCKILKQPVSKNDKKIFKFLYSKNIRDVEDALERYYEYNKSLTEDIVIHLCNMYGICIKNVLTRKARNRRMAY